MTVDVLVTRKIPGDFLKELNPHYDRVTVWSKDKPIDVKNLRRIIGNYEVLICMVNDRIDERLLRLGKRLRCVITFSVGLDHIDIKALANRNILLVSMPDFLTTATAELTLALIFACARKLVPAVEFMRANKFTGYSPSLYLGRELSDSIIGVVGMGRIGRAVAERAHGLGMQVLYHSPRRSNSQWEKKLGAHYLPLRALLKKCDILTLHCSLNPDTFHLIGRKELELMKETAILVNTSRGAVIDEKALVHHLSNNGSFFAGLDVYENEPKFSKQLLKLPNAVCLPHIGSASKGCRRIIAKICVQEAIRFAKSKRLRYEYPLA